jgi:hypothetical protein
MSPHVNATARKCFAHDTPSGFLACMLVHLSRLATLVLCELYRYSRHAVAPSTMIDNNLAGTAGAPYKASRANHSTTSALQADETVSTSCRGRWSSIAMTDCQTLGMQAREIEQWPQRRKTLEAKKEKKQAQPLSKPTVPV